MNTLKRLMLVGIRSILPTTVRLLKYNTKHLRTHNNLFLTVGLAGFLWPIKKIKPENKSIVEERPFPDDLAIADDLFENGKYDDCYQFLTALKNNHEVEVVWRICRVMYNISKESRTKEEKKKLILKAYEMILDKLETSKDNFAVQKWYAILLDAKSNYDGMKERIKQLENVKKHMDLAVTLNPNDATTLYMIGEWCYQVSELSWYERKIAETFFASPPKSSYEDALEYFLRAETVQPRFYSLNLLRLGKCYLKLQKEDQAKYYLQLAASYPAKTNDDHQANKEAANLLKKIK